MTTSQMSALGEVSQNTLERAESEPGRVGKAIPCRLSLKVMLPHTDKNVLEGWFIEWEEDRLRQTG